MSRGSAAEPPPDLMQLGAVRGAYGVNGWVRIALRGSEGAVLQGTPQWWLLGQQDVRPVQLEGCRRHGTALLAKWSGCDSKEAADALRGALIAVPRSAFPPPAPGEHYWVDLLGCRVVNRSGEELGAVAALSENGASQWLEVDRAEGGPRILIPLVAQYVEGVEPEQRIIRVDWKKDW